MATVTKRNDYQWQAKVRRKGHPTQSKTFNSKHDAEIWARSIESSMDLGVFVSRAEAERTTLAEALTRYEIEVSRYKKGYEAEKYRIKRWKRQKLAQYSLAAINSTEIAKYRDDRLNEGVTPSTIHKELGLISHLFNIARKEWGIMIQNPVSNIRLPKVDNARSRRLEEDEEERLLHALTAPAGPRSNIYVKPVVMLAIETAMRQGELLSLQWKHVDLEKQVAHLPDTKNGTARDVPLSRRAVAILKGLPRSIDGLVFPTTQNALKLSWNRAVERARQAYVSECEARGIAANPDILTDLHFHDLRHEATSRLAEKLSLHELMRATGHKDTRMLARYFHPRAADLAKKLG